MVAVRGGHVAGHCRRRAHRTQASYASHRSHAPVRSQGSCWWYRAILDRTRRLARAGHRSSRCCFRQNARRPAKCLNIFQRNVSNNTGREGSGTDRVLRKKEKKKGGGDDG